MKIEALGHVVIRVRDLQRSEAFYRDLLGIEVSARAEEGSMTFFTLGRHHDFAIAQTETADGGGEGDGREGDADSGSPNPGLDHVAFQLSGGLEELHVELYVDAGEGWREDRDLILSPAGPLPE